MPGTDGRLLYPADFVGRLEEELAAAKGTWARAVDLLPEGDECRALLEVCFLGSLLEEEGRPISFTLGFTPSSSKYARAETLAFSRPLPLSAEAIRRLAPALNPERTHIAAERTPTGLMVWGLIHFGRPALPTGERYSPPYLSVHVRRPAEFEVRLMTSTLMRYSRGSGTVRMHAAEHAESRLAQLLARLLPTEAEQTERHHAALYLADIARELQRRNKGGIVLVVSLDARPIGLDLHEHFTPMPVDGGILARHFARSLQIVSSPRTRGLEPSLVARFELQRRREAIEFVASLAGIDGALVLDTRLDILGFGARIRLAQPSESLPTVHVLGPGGLATEELFPAPTFLGMRHRSSIQFCQMQRAPVVALVVSQDGDVSLVAKSRLEEGKVIAAIPLEEDVP